MFCECWSCQRTWRGCPWRLVSASAGEAQRRQTWPTRSKRSSSVLPLNSFSLVVDYLFIYYKTLNRIAFRCSTEKENLKDFQIYQQKKKIQMCQILFRYNLKKVPVLLAGCFHQQYFSPLLSLFGCHYSRGGGSLHIIEMSSPCCALLYAYQLSPLLSSLLSLVRYHISWEFFPNDYHAS